MNRLTPGFLEPNLVVVYKGRNIDIVPIVISSE